VEDLNLLWKMLKVPYSVSRVLYSTGSVVGGLLANPKIGEIRALETPAAATSTSTVS
jgi:hypothetical protein